MGKIRTRILGYEEVEKKQKDQQKRRSQEKKAAATKISSAKHKIRAQGLKGGERLVQVEVDQSAVEKMEKAKKALESKEPSVAKAVPDQRKKKKITTHHKGKNYQKAKKEIEKQFKMLEVGSKKLEEKQKPPTSNLKRLTLLEAIKLLKKIKYAKFDESVELHLNVDKTGLKGEVELAHATGKSVRVKIVDDKLLEDIDKGKLEFDILVTHPQYMPKLVKYAKVLGPKGLMPNPKAGTISPQPEEIAKKFAKGGLRWKTEPKAPIIHQMIGKVSLDEKKLAENASLFLSSVGKSHIQSAFIKTSMSPSVRVDVEKI